MRVVVRLQAQVKQAAGRAVVEMDVPAGTSVEEVVRKLVQAHEGLARLLLTGTGRVQPTLLLFRGDEQVEPADVLAEGDELTLLAPMAGG
jgi:molybdopterin converting factor small subunit